MVQSPACGTSAWKRFMKRSASSYTEPGFRPAAGLPFSDRRFHRRLLHPSDPHPGPVPAPPAARREISPAAFLQLFFRGLHLFHPAGHRFFRGPRRQHPRQQGTAHLPADARSTSGCWIPGKGSGFRSGRSWLRRFFRPWRGSSRSGARASSCHERLTGFTSHWMTYAGLLMFPFIFFSVLLLLRRRSKKETARHLRRPGGHAGRHRLLPDPERLAGHRRRPGALPRFFQAQVFPGAGAAAAGPGPAGAAGGEKPRALHRRPAGPLQPRPDLHGLFGAEDLPGPSLDRGGQPQHREGHPRQRGALPPPAGGAGQPAPAQQFPADPGRKGDLRPGQFHPGLSVHHPAAARLLRRPGAGSGAPSRRASFSPSSASWSPGCSNTTSATARSSSSFFIFSACLFCT